MKRFWHILIVVAFVGILWIPLISTPFQHEKERKILRYAERREPTKLLSLKECNGDVAVWVKKIQQSYQDCFAFRSSLLRVFNSFHYLIHNYPHGYYGQDAHLFKKGLINKRLRPDGEDQWVLRKRKIRTLRRICDQSEVPFLFVIIPAKDTVHPELAPSWIRTRSTESRRQKIVELIRVAQFPVVDLSVPLKKEAQETGTIFFWKYDNHWNLEGALLGYREMMSAICELLPSARTVEETDYSVALKKHTKGFIRRLYLDYTVSESSRVIDQIHLPPVKVIQNGKERRKSVVRIAREGQAEVFSRGLGDQTVVFVRDSFLTQPSALLNHSFGHTVYLNNSVEGTNPEEIIEKYHPDLLVFALQEELVANYLDNMVD